MIQQFWFLIEWLAITLFLDVMLYLELRFTIVTDTTLTLTKVFDWLIAFTTFTVMANIHSIYHLENVGLSLLVYSYAVIGIYLVCRVSRQYMTKDGRYNKATYGECALLNFVILMVTIVLHG